MDDDFFDENACSLKRLGVVSAGQGLGKVCDPVRVDLGNSRVQCQRRSGACRRCLGELRFQAFELRQLRQDSGAGPAIANGVDQVCDPSIDGGVPPLTSDIFRMSLASDAGTFLIKHGDELGDNVRLHEPPPQNFEHMCFDHHAADSSLVSAGAVRRRAAAQVVLAGGLEEATTTTALDFAGQ